MPRLRYLALAAGVAIVVVAGGPFALQARLALGAAFPASFGTIVRGGITAAVAAAMLVALVRIREQRLLRYLGLATALTVGVVFARVSRTGNSAIDVVEAFHFVEYRVLASLFYAVWLPVDDGSIVILPLLSGLLVGALDEGFQWFVPFRVGEIRDVVLNLVAVICGLIFSLALNPPPRLRLCVRRDSIPRIYTLFTLVMLVLAVFVQIVHLGYDVRDEGTGTFRSRYTQEQLASAAVDRSERWRRDPPVTPELFSREDQFLAEALWHVRRRNEAEQTGDVSTAWQENRILETFFAPVLDTPSYVSASGFRWSPVQRENAALRVPSSTAPYRSRAEPYPLYAWPRARFWTAIALLVSVSGVIGLTSRCGFPVSLCD